jgi:hypothetical protein
VVVLVVVVIEAIFAVTFLYVLVVAIAFVLVSHFDVLLLHGLTSFVAATVPFLTSSSLKDASKTFPSTADLPVSSVLLSAISAN